MELRGTGRTVYGKRDTACGDVFEELVANKLIVMDQPRILQGS